MPPIGKESVKNAGELRGLNRPRGFLFATIFKRLDEKRDLNARPISTAN